MLLPWSRSLCFYPLRCGSEEDCPQPTRRYGGEEGEGAEASSSSSSSSSSSLHDLVILDPNVPDFFDEADLELEDKIVADAQEREAKMWERDEVSRGEPSH